LGGGIEVNQALQKVQPVDEVVKLLQSFEGQIKLALPKHLTASRMTRVLITEVRKTPKLASCDRASFMGAIITCAQLGLEPGSGLGQVYLIPYGREVQMQIGYQGMIELAERDGRVTVSANVVYEKDVFEWEEGTTEYIKHKPYFGKESPGEVIASYAVARYKDGRVKFRVCPLHEIEKARGNSKSGSSGPWKTHFSEMARKTAVKRLFKLLPKSPEIARAIEIEEKSEISDSQGLGDVFKEFKQEHNISLPDADVETIDVKDVIFFKNNPEQVKEVTQTLIKLDIPEEKHSEIFTILDGKDLNAGLTAILEGWK
jgi:recombination protein RecT